MSLSVNILKQRRDALIERVRRGGEYFVAVRVLKNGEYFRFADKRFDDAAGIHFGVITRLSDIGERFSGHGGSGPGGMQGAIELDLSDAENDLYQFKQTNVEGGLIDIRTGCEGMGGWDDLVPLSVGVLQDCSLDHRNDVFTARILDYSYYKCDQNFTGVQFPVAGCGGEQVPFGHAVRLRPVAYEKHSNGDYKFVVSQAPLYDPSYQVFRGGKVATEAHGDINQCAFYLDGFDDEPLPVPPESEISHDVTVHVKGVDDAGTEISDAARILHKLIAMAVTWSRPFEPADIHNDSFNRFVASNPFYVGLIVGDETKSWREIFNHLISSIGGIWYFDAQQNLRLESLSIPPTAAIAATIHPSDFADYSVSAASNPGSVKVSLVEFGSDNDEEITVTGTPGGQSVSIDTAITNLSHANTVSGRIAQPWGDWDVHFEKCWQALTLDVGDRVTLNNLEAPLLSKTGVVTGVDRAGLNLWVRV